MEVLIRRHPGPTPAKVVLDHPVYPPVQLVFNYALRFADGTYYTGDERLFGLRCEAYTFTEQGARAKVERMGWQATVERLR